jgi:hypothetical protein
MLVGNDIVDFADPESRLESLHPRFVDRVCSTAEQTSIAASRCPERSLWAHWAAKESAYKVMRKLDPSIVFSPSRFEIQIDEAVSDAVLHGRVSAGGRLLPLGLEITEDWVHACVRTPGDGTASRWVRRIPGKSTPSTFARQLIRHCFAAPLGVSPVELRIVGSRPPRLFFGDEPLDVDVSLSHHGRWVAVACAELGETA